jgi:hypothetical protein
LINKATRIEATAAIAAFAIFEQPGLDGCCSYATKIKAYSGTTGHALATLTSAAQTPGARDQAAALLYSTVATRVQPARLRVQIYHGAFLERFVGN